MKQIALWLFFALLISCVQPERFELLNSEITGVTFSNEVLEEDTFNILRNEYMYNGGGVGIGDLNNDGLQDIVLVGNVVSTRIYLNLGDFKFQDITDQFEGISDGQWFSGVSFVDINGDDQLDVYLTATMSKDSLERKNRLWVNQGGEVPTFTEKSESYGIADMGYSVHAGFFDYDLDGDLDLYILNNTVSKVIPTNYRPKVVDGSAINNDKLYENLGDGSFQDVTLKAGIIYEGFGLGLAFGDVNKDGYPDIYVSNDYIANDLLYINQGDGTFRNSSESYISYHSKFSMGNDMSDFNNDGNPDIITLDMLPEKYFRKKQTINGNSYVMYINDEKYDYQHQYVRNMLHAHNGFLNDRMLPFSEIGQLSGVCQTEWSWSPLFADFDNDGDKDLMITNGFPKDLTDKDFTNYKAEVHGFVASDQQVISKIPVVKVANYAYENNGDNTFSDRTVDWGMDRPSFSNGAAFTDLDNDGDLDYVVNNINDEAFIYQNKAIENGGKKAGFIRIILKGSDKNTLALGAKVEVWSKSGYQFYEHFLSRGYISSVDPTVHFGLNGDKKIDSLMVKWPGAKRVTALKNLESNQTLVLYESDAKSTEHREVQRTPALLFSKKDSAINYVHQEKDYIDFFQNQNILQHKFSQIGPCMAKGDLNGDGMEDLLIGASNKSPTMVYLRDGLGFLEVEMEGLTGRKKCQESDLVILDIDGDEDQDVVSLAGGYTNDDQKDYKHYIYVNEGNRFTKIEVPLPAFPASVVRPFDFDNDGDPDLFVGARVKKGEFPFAGRSYLLENEAGALRYDSALSFALGMVTDAVWSDIDGDGWEDVLVTTEWGAVNLLKNQKGTQLTLEMDKNLNSKLGAWTAVIAVDLDGDNDDDFIVGNLGDNHSFQVNDTYPMSLYAVDIDKNGTIDPIISSYWKDQEGVMQEYPINYRDELASQSPFFKKQFTSYTDFSYSKIADFLDLAAIPAENKFTINTLSSYILWNDKGKFRWEKLPLAFQTAPVKEMLVMDFNGDSYLDVLISGNDYTYNPSTGNFDANKGLVLAGTGSPDFKVLKPGETGLFLQGQVESLLYFDGDIPLLVAGINRDKLAVFEHHQDKKKK